MQQGPMEIGTGTEPEVELDSSMDIADMEHSGQDAEHGADQDAEQAEGPTESPEEADPDGESKKSSGRLGAGEQLSDGELMQQVTALLFASSEPLSLGKLTKLLKRPRRGRVKDALAALGETLQKAGLPIQVRTIQGGYTLMTEPELGPVVERLLSGPAVERVSAAALETLAVVAYRQPVTKAEIEAIRGVQAGPILRSLVDRGLIRVEGRAEVPGSPLQYGTTKDFLDRFGLEGVTDLPRDAELAED